MLAKPTEPESDTAASEIELKVKKEFSLNPIQTTIAACMFILVIMGGVWAVSSEMSHDYVTFREYDAGMAHISELIKDLNMHFQILDDYIRGKK